MDSIQELLTTEIGKIVTPGKLLYSLVLQRLATHSVRLSPKQRASLNKQLKLCADLESATFNIDFSKRQTAKLKDLLDEKTGGLDLAFSDAEVEKVMAAYEEASSAVIPILAHKIAIRVSKEWRKQEQDVLALVQKDRTDLQAVVRRKWRRALDSLEVLVDQCTDLGSQFNQYYEPNARKADDPVYLVLVHLHARACQVGREISVMLQNGFADGAMARWRTLHEIAVVLSFVEQSGAETASRYIEHGAIADFKESIHFQKHAKTLGYRPFRKRELTQLTRERDRLCGLYGKEFATDYGWAAKITGNARPTFADIEQRVSMDHMRPVYGLANHNVHAGSKGAFVRLGQSDGVDSLLIAGGSVFGLEEPGRNTAYSLVWATTEFVTAHPTVDSVAAALALKDFRDTTVKRFDRIAARIGPAAG